MKDALCIAGIALALAFLLGFAWLALSVPMP